MKPINPITNPKFSNILSILEILQTANRPLTMMQIKSIYSKLHNISKYKTNLSFTQTLHHAKDSCLKKGYLRRLGTDRFKSKYEVTISGIRYYQKSMKEEKR